MTTNKSAKVKKELPFELKLRLTRIAVALISVLCAFFLWLYAIGYDSTLFEKTFNGVQVTIIGVDELSASKGYTLAQEEKISSVTVVAKGKRSELNELDASDFTAYIDISTATKAGKQSFDIVVDSPNGVEVVSQSSSQWELVVDRFLKRQELLAVNVDTGNGNAVMTDGVLYFTEKVNPLAVEVEGPESMLDEIEGAYVKFTLDDILVSDNINGWGPIELRDKDGNVINNPYIKLLENTAYVEIEVTKKKTVPVEVVFKGGLELNPVQSAIPSVQSITVMGTPSELAKLNTYVIEIDETTIKNSTSLTFPVTLPEKLQRDESTPAEITVYVDLREGMTSRSFSFSRRDITINNLPEGVRYSVKDGVVITVVGTDESISQIDKKLISVAVNYDASKVIANRDDTYTAEITVSLGAEYSDIYILNEKHTVDFELK